MDSPIVLGNCEICINVPILIYPIKFWYSALDLPDLHC